MARERYPAGPPLDPGDVARPEAPERAAAQLPRVADAARAAADVHHPPHQLHRRARLQARRQIYLLCESNRGHGMGGLC